MVVSLTVQQYDHSINHSILESSNRLPFLCNTSIFCAFGSTLPSGYFVVFQKECTHVLRNQADSITEHWRKLKKSSIMHRFCFRSDPINMSIIPLQFNAEHMQCLYLPQKICVPFKSGPECTQRQWWLCVLLNGDPILVFKRIVLVLNNNKLATPICSSLTPPWMWINDQLWFNNLTFKNVNIG